MKINIKNHLPPARLSLVFVAVLALYLVYRYLKIDWAMAIFGLPLFLYFPGRFLLDSFPVLKFNNGKFGQFSLAVLFSFCFAAVLGFMIQRSINFNTVYQSWGIVFLNPMAFIVYCFFHHQKDQEKSYPIVWLDFLPLGILALVMAAIVWINPLAQNADDYLTLLRQSILQNINLSDMRPLFVSFINLSNQFLSVNNLLIYRNIFLVLFLISTLSFYDYLKRNLQPGLMIGLLYLTLLAPSVILTELNIIRPQVILIFVTIPVLILSFESIKLKNILAALAALLVAVVALVFHELAITLLGAAFLALVINILRLIFIEKKLTWRHLLLFVIIIIPYFLAFNLFGSQLCVLLWPQNYF